MNTYIIRDEINGRIISKHRSLRTAVLATRNHSAAVKRRNGPGSYVWCKITDATGARICPDLLAAAETAIQNR